MLKRLTLFNFVLFMIGPLAGQTSNDSTQPDTYLFSSFQEGIVLEKKGGIDKALLNYNTENQSIIFKQGEQNMILTGLDNIDTVYIGDRKFIHAEDKFYEVGAPTPITLLISYTYRTVPTEAQVDHNGTSQQKAGQVNNTLSNAYLNRRFQGHHEIVFTPRFWLKRGNSLYKAGNERQVTGVFPHKANSIRAFIADHHIQFDNPENMASLIRFCSE